MFKTLVYWTPYRCIFLRNIFLFVYCWYDWMIYCGISHYIKRSAYHDTGDSFLLCIKFPRKFSCTCKSWQCLCTLSWRHSGERRHVCETISSCQFVLVGLGITPWTNCSYLIDAAAVVLVVTDCRGGCCSSLSSVLINVKVCSDYHISHLTSYSWMYSFVYLCWCSPSPISLVLCCQWSKECSTRVNRIVFPFWNELS